MDEFQPQAAPDTEAIGFPVDLSREEYIAFNMLLAKNGGMLRFRKGQLVIFGLMMAFSLVMLAVEFFMFQSLDVVMILVVAFIALTGGFLLFGMPAYLRRNAGRAYDQSVLGGHEYYGMVYVYEDRLEKVSGGTVNRVYYGENAAYGAARLLQPGHRAARPVHDQGGCRAGAPDGAPPHSAHAPAPVKQDGAAGLPADGSAPRRGGESSG